MTAFVLDASVALGWLLDQPTSGYALRVQQHMLSGARVLVPIHWHLEIANALLTASRRKALRKSLAEILPLITELGLFITTDDQPDDIARLTGLGEREQLTAYDAAYVALAERCHLALASQDAAMLTAARRLRIPIVN